MSDWERPPLPTEGEKSRLIAAAVEAALPPRASAPARLSRTLHALGLPCCSSAWRTACFWPWRQRSHALRRWATWRRTRGSWRRFCSCSRRFCMRRSRSFRCGRSAWTARGVAPLLPPAFPGGRGAAHARLRRGVGGGERCGEPVAVGRAGTGGPPGRDARRVVFQSVLLCRSVVGVPARAPAWRRFRRAGRVVRARRGAGGVGGGRRRCAECPDCGVCAGGGRVVRALPVGVRALCRLAGEGGLRYAFR